VRGQVIQLFRTRQFNGSVGVLFRAMRIAGAVTDTAELK
jgi:hypothetical protein